MTTQSRFAEPDAHAADTSGDTIRAEYRERLRQHLQDPAFRATEGFPIGADEAILNLSDPPYYTACPNPFLPETIERWREERAQLRGELGLPGDSGDEGGGENGCYLREPFAADVSEGKNDPIYNAHSYHTKVPHKAIMRYILHYTEPGDLVLDFFCGTGMTGVAAQECGLADAPQYANLLRSTPGAHAGERRALLIDLAPIATYIAHSYVKSVDIAAFQILARDVITESKMVHGWMYKTAHSGWLALAGDADTWSNVTHSTNDESGVINFVVWSERFVCPTCSNEFTLWTAGVDPKTGEAKKEFPCPACGAAVSKRRLSRAMETIADPLRTEAVRRVKREPVLINYTWNGRRYEKFPEADDLAVIEKPSTFSSSTTVPVQQLPGGERRLKDAYDNLGITRVHHFYFDRTLAVLSDLWSRIQSIPFDERSLLTILFTSQLVNLSLMNRFRRVSFPYNPFSGTLYVGSIVSEANPYQAYENKLIKFVRAKSARAPLASIVSTQSATLLPQIPGNSIDYIFIDPPFGRNLHYSELNFLWEAWLDLTTNRELEAVMDRGRNRELFEYQDLMRRCFREGYRVLRPGRWMTVEFHNTSNAVWNAIQEGILSSGFMVADVRTLDKGGDTYKQSQQGLVKADLIISAYKPSNTLVERFKIETGTEKGAWDFMRQHLAHLPRVVEQGGVLEPIAERHPYLLFDRMIAFHIQRGATVPLSAAAFYAGLRQQFVERDGMIFLPDQVPEYDAARMRAERVGQLALFVNDEKSSIQWLRQLLDPATGGAPLTYQEILPQFLRQLHQARHEQLPELGEILDQNFLQDPHARWYVPDPNRAEDLERVRRNALLREFATYLAGRGRLRSFRTEAVRAGFADAYRRGAFADIVALAERLPDAVLQEDPDLLMYYDNASLRVG